ARRFQAIQYRSDPLIQLFQLDDADFQIVWLRNDARHRAPMAVGSAFRGLAGIAEEAIEGESIPSQIAFGKSLGVGALQQVPDERIVLVRQSKVREFVLVA